MITKVPNSKDKEYVRKLWNDLRNIKVPGAEINAAFRKFQQKIYNSNTLFIFKEPENVEKSCDINNHDL